MLKTQNFMHAFVHPILGPTLGNTTSTFAESNSGNSPSIGIICGRDQPEDVPIEQLTLQSKVGDSRLPNFMCTWRSQEVTSSCHPTDRRMGNHWLQKKHYLCPNLPKTQNMELPVSPHAKVS